MGEELEVEGKGERMEDGGRMPVYAGLTDGQSAPDRIEKVRNERPANFVAPKINPRRKNLKNLLLTRKIQLARGF